MKTLKASIFLILFKLCHISGDDNIPPPANPPPPTVEIEVEEEPQTLWIGPGWYYGVWFDNEVEYDGWYHDHRRWDDRHHDGQHRHHQGGGHHRGGGGHHGGGGHK